MNNDKEKGATMDSVAWFWLLVIITFLLSILGAGWLDSRIEIEKLRLERAKYEAIAAQGKAATLFEATPTPEER